MKDKRIIVLTGKSQSGKSLIAKHLSRIHGFVRYRIADTLKSMLKAFGLDGEEIDGGLKECVCEMLLGKTPRYAMQTLGTEWGRNFIHKDIWINKLCKDIKQSIYINVSIDDLRFLNEREVLFREFGEENVFIIRIIRDSVIYSGNKHVSETEMDQIDVDWTVYNNGTVEDLYKSIDQIIDVKYGEEGK